jgi:hypothetical protein
MNISCANCSALHWAGELNKKVGNRQLFSMCCGYGKIKLNALLPPPEPLNHLLTAIDKQSKEFRRNIRNYNNALAMTSIGASGNIAAHTTNGIFTYKLHGQLYHRIGSLLPEPNRTPAFAQIYIYDTDHEVDNRLHACQADVDKKTLEQLQIHYFLFMSFLAPLLPDFNFIPTTR